MHGLEGGLSCRHMCSFSCCCCCDGGFAAIYGFVERGTSPLEADSRQAVCVNIQEVTASSCRLLANGRENRGEGELCMENGVTDALDK